MTDVQQQVEPSRTKTRKRAPKRKRGRAPKQSAQARQPDQIEFDDKAIAQGKKLVAAIKSDEKRLESSEMKLGELADRLKPVYGEETVAVFAHQIGISAATLKRYRSAYRAWKGIEAPAPSFAVVKELQAHPDKAEILEQYRKQDRKLTKREARTIMKNYRKTHAEDLDWRVTEMRRSLDEVTEFARKVYEKFGHLSKQHIDRAVLLQAVDNKDMMLTTWRLGGLTLSDYADVVESALEPLAALPPPLDEAEAKPDAASDEAAPSDDDADEATPDQTT